MRGKKKNLAPRTAVRLSPGIRLDGAQQPVLLCPEGKVQLNQIAATILRLCDGSRDRQAVVDEVLRRSQQATRAKQIIEFLDVARARGWIDEA